MSYSFGHGRAARARAARGSATRAHALDNPDGKSITHLEYDHARYTKPVFVFLLAPQYPQEVRWVDAGAREPTSKIGAFRRDVDANHVRALFTTPDSLASEVLRALILYEQRHPTPVAAFHWPTAWDFTAFIEERRAGFYGRYWLFEETRNWIGATHPRALLIKADLGVGKSAFLSELVCRNPGNSILAWHFCQHDTEETLKPATFVRSLAAHLANALPEYRTIVESDPGMQERLSLEDASSFLEAVILNPLRKVPVPASQRVLVLDALDEALELDPELARKAGTILSLLSDKASRFPDWLRILATSRKTPTVVDGLRAVFGVREIDAEDARNQHDLDGYVLGRCVSRPISDKLLASGKEPSTIVTLLRERSEGKFLNAVRALNDLANGTISVEEVAELQPGMDEFYVKAFKRRFGDAGPGYGPFRELLGVLAVAREPLPLRTLAASLGRPEAEIAKQRTKVSDFVAMRRGGCALDHFSLAEWLTKNNDDGVPRASAWAVDLPAAEETFRTWAMGRVEAGEAHREPYLVRHLGSHLAGQERERVFARLLFDARWLYARLHAAGVHALIDDCALVQQSEAVRLLRMALRNSAHVVATEPRLLPGQLIGRLGGHDLPELQALCRAFQYSSGEWGCALLPLSASLSLSVALMATLRGEHVVRALAALPNGRLAVGYQHGPVRIWVPGSGSEPSIVQGYKYGVTSLVALSGGGLAAATERGFVYVWERPGESEAVLLANHDWRREIHQLALLRDGRLASASGDRTVTWDPAARTQPIVLRDGEYGVCTLAELPDGRLASGSNDGTVRVWNTSGGVEPVVLKGHQGDVRKLVALPDGRLASAGNDKTIRVWDPIGGAPSFALSGHEGHVMALAALPDGRLASGSSDGRIRMWVLSPQSTPVVLDGHKENVRALMPLPDGRLASGADDRDVRVWDPSGGGHVVLHRHESLIATLAVLPDGRLASGCGDGSVSVLDVESRTGLASTSEGEIPISALAVLPDGRLVWGAEDCTVRVRDLTTGDERVLWRGRARPVDSLRVLPQGGLACATSEEVILLRDLTRRSKARVLRTRENIVGALAVLPDGRLASAAMDNTVRVWHPDRRHELRLLEGHKDWVWSLAVLPDGRLASGSSNEIHLWNLEGDDEPLILGGHESTVFALAVLFDGWLASGSGDHTVRVWDPTGHQAPLVLRGHEGLVNGLAALPGKRLASCARDQTVRVWDLNGRCEIARFHTDARIDALAATADGLILAGDVRGKLHKLRLFESLR
jgi:WD40 repeat protein